VGSLSGRVEWNDRAREYQHNHLFGARQVWKNVSFVIDLAEGWVHFDHGGLVRLYICGLMSLWRSGSSNHHQLESSKIAIFVYKNARKA
jgi:hypothetical protein